MSDSFLLAEAFSTPIPLFWFIGTQIIGVDTMLTAAKPSWATTVSVRVLVSAILLWGMMSIIAFIFWETFPYEIMKDFPKKLVIPLIVALWAGLYNTPLLTMWQDLFDVIFFGFLYTLTYHKTRNSIGILAAYLLNENPLWWVISSMFRPYEGIAFQVFLVVRVLICLTCLTILLLRKLKA